jgi:hypothetical protein
LAPCLAAVLWAFFSGAFLAAILWSFLGAAAFAGAFAGFTSFLDYFDVGFAIEFDACFILPTLSMVNL